MERNSASFIGAYNPKMQMSAAGANSRICGIASTAMRVAVCMPT
jgi:hypothetical protein